MAENDIEKLKRGWEALPAAYKVGIISAFLIFSAGIAIDQVRRYEKYKALANEVYSIADTSGNQKIERKEAKELSSENDCWTYFTKKAYQSRMLT